MPIFALVDCNNFYVSCQRVFNPSLEKKPVIVLSNNDGCVVARSNEVKNAGIPMGAPYFKCKKILEKMKCEIFSSNYSLYGDMSARVMKILASTDHEMEIYSIDEAFLDLSQIPKNELIQFCQNLKAHVKKCTGIPVSIGVGSTKTLAKLANNLAKDDARKGAKIYNDVFSFVGLSDNELLKIFENVKVGDLWGIGRQGAKKLQANDVITAKDLMAKSSQWIKKYLTIQGLYLVQELKGDISYKLELFAKDKKSIASTRSFGKPVTTIDDLKQAITNHAVRIGEKLRRGGQVASFMQVFAMSSRFKDGFTYKSQNIKFPDPTNFTPQIVKYAVREIEKIFQSDEINNINYKKVGIIVTDLQQSTSVQTPLFSNKKFSTEKENVLMRVFDTLNKKYGKLTLRPAQLGYSTAWHMQQNLTSQRYTTQWKELLTI